PRAARRAPDPTKRRHRARARTPFLSDVADGPDRSRASARSPTDLLGAPERPPLVGHAYALGYDGGVRSDGRSPNVGFTRSLAGVVERSPLRGPRRHEHRTRSALRRTSNPARYLVRLGDPRIRGDR